MKYKYRKGDLIYILKNGKRTFVASALETGPYIVKKYDPANRDPDKRLQVYGENYNPVTKVTYRTKLFFCNPANTRPDNTDQELDTGKVVPCLRKSIEAKMALLLGDYPLYPDLKKGDTVKFTHNEKELIGTVQDSILESRRIVVRVLVNGYKKQFEVDETEAEYISSSPSEEAA